MVLRFSLVSLPTTVSRFKLTFFAHELQQKTKDGLCECDHIDNLIRCLAIGWSNKYPVIKFYYHACEQLTLTINNQTREKSVAVAEMHYNLGNDLYELMLDPGMNYACACWKEDTKTLEEAQINKIDLVARKLNLKPGMKILDLGCGFAPVAKYLAQNYEVSVTCYNISTEQVKYAKKSCKGLDVTFIIEDYCNATGQYDRVYSIGFFEHVGIQNFHDYFQVVHRCLKDDGLTLLHSITTNGSAPFHVRNPRWTTKYVFSGGELPFVSDMLTFSKDLFTVEDVQSLGKSYQKMLLAWHQNFNDNWEKYLKAKYDSQQGGKFFHMWNFYLLHCAGAFDSRCIRVHQAVYWKYGRKEEYKSVH